jgi:hypothetical protein
MIKSFVSVFFAALATACAMPSSRIATSYTSPLHYQSFDCDQLQAEGRRLSANISSLAPRLDQAARNDKWIAGLGVLMFPPVPLLALGGNRVQEQEYGRLRGELDAVNMMLIQKKCPSVISPANAGAAASASPPSSPALDAAQTPR